MSDGRGERDRGRDLSQKGVISAHRGMVTQTALSVTCFQFIEGFGWSANSKWHLSLQDIKILISSHQQLSSSSHAAGKPLQVGPVTQRITGSGSGSTTTNVGSISCHSRC